MKYDTIVVGGGIAGLTAAAYLAKSGQTVLLLEKQSTLGGQVQTFFRNGIAFDTGLRSIENSGIVFPMLKQLGIEIEFVKSNISIGIGENVITLVDKDSLKRYEDFLNNEFQENKNDIRLIIDEIRKIMGYMDILYGIDNPAFIDIAKDKKYLFKVLIPWMLKFAVTLRKIKQLNEPVEEYLKKFTKNQALIDVIAQHFFKETPTSFALSYFSLYLDYFYPKGGTGAVIESIGGYIRENGGKIETSRIVASLNPEKKLVQDNIGNKYEYNHLVWAADIKQMYNCIPINEISNTKLIERIVAKKEYLKEMRGGDSIFAVYLSIDLDREYFAKVSSGHFFYTPYKDGLSSIDMTHLDLLMNQKKFNPKDSQLKESIFDYCKKLCDLNTLEIAIPNLRDPDLAPKGKTGLIVSLLFDYSLAKKLNDAGWMNELKDVVEQRIIKILDDTIYSGIKDAVIDCFSSTPLTIEKRTNSYEGGITGWAFTNPTMPAENGMLTIAKSVDTILPAVYQAGQWAYSPSGFPISVLTGKLAVDKVLKAVKR